MLIITPKTTGLLSTNTLPTHKTLVRETVLLLTVSPERNFFVVYGYTLGSLGTDGKRSEQIEVPRSVPVLSFGRRVPT